MNFQVEEEADTPLASFEASGATTEATKLIIEGRVQMTTVMLHVNNLILSGEGAKNTLVRPIDTLHVENIKTLMFEKPAGFSAPFLLMVDPKDCPTKHYWKTDPNIHQRWKYYVIGGNHGARAKKDLFETYGKNIFAQVEA